MLKPLFIRLSCLLTMLLVVRIATAQTKHTVQVGDNFFNPSSFNANVGDTVRWVFITGSMENHNTASTTIPSGAASWINSVNTNNPSFEYIITEPGTYNYVCTPHVSLGMVASFTASPTTSVKETFSTSKSSIAPNPATNVINISTAFDKSDITMLDMQGRLVKSWKNINADNTLDVSEVPAGLYIIAIQVGKITYKDKLVLSK